MELLKTRSQRSYSVRLFLVILTNLLFFSNAFASIEAVIGDVALKDNANLAGFMPSSESSEVIISRKQYVISYNKERRSPNWVAWKVEANQLGSSGRTNVFSQDSELETYLNRTATGSHAVEPTEFQGSCFDRGHQIPSADRTDTAANNQTTFMMSNMIPQTPYLNRVIWEHFEHYTREIVRQGKKVYLIAGPVYDENFGFIGPQKDIPVPSKDFKILIILEANQTPKDINQNTPIISVLMPNVLEDGSKPLDHAKLCGTSPPINVLNVNDWEQYKTSLAEIKRVSGLSLPNLQSLLPSAEISKF